MPRRSRANTRPSRRLRLNELLGVDSFDDPVVAGRLRRSIEDVEKHARQFFKQMEQPPASSAAFSGSQLLSDWEIRAAVEEMEADVVAWAVVPALLQSHFRDPQTPVDLLRRLGEEAPNATADAALAVLHDRGVSIVSSGMSAAFGGGVGGGTIDRGIAIHAGNAELIRQAIELVGQYTTKPEVALREFEKIREQLRNAPQEIAWRSDWSDAVESAIEELE